MESNSENEIDASEEDKDISMNDDSADENNDKGENVSGDNVEDDMSDIIGVNEKKEHRRKYFSF